MHRRTFLGYGLAAIAVAVMASSAKAANAAATGPENTKANPNHSADLETQATASSADEVGAQWGWRRRRYRRFYRRRYRWGRRYLRRRYRWGW
jgi:hypothetical protein